MKWEIVDDFPKTVTCGAVLSHVARAVVLKSDVVDGRETHQRVVIPNKRLGLPELGRTHELESFPRWSMTCRQGLKIDERTGRIVWNTKTDQMPVFDEGRAIVQVRVGCRLRWRRDADYSERYLEFPLEVTRNIPVIRPVDDITVVSGEPLSIQPEILDKLERPKDPKWQLFAPGAFWDMNLDPKTGSLTWPQSRFIRRARDPQGKMVDEITLKVNATYGEASLTFKVCVLARPPEFVQPPDATVNSGEQYQCQLELKEVADGPLKFRLASPADGIIDSNGLVVWDSCYTPGPVRFEARVSGPGGTHSVFWNVTVECEAPVLKAIPDFTATEGELYRQTVELEKGSGFLNISFASDKPSTMDLHPVGVPPRAYELIWSTRCDGQDLRLVHLAIVAENEVGRHVLEWTLLVKREPEPPPEVASCNTRTSPPPPVVQCCQPQLEVYCSHYDAEGIGQDIRNVGWAGFFVYEFTVIPPRSYKMTLPVTGDIQVNEKKSSELTPEEEMLFLRPPTHSTPLFQVISGYLQKWERVMLDLSHVNCSQAHELIAVVTPRHEKQDSVAWNFKPGEVPSSPTEARAAEFTAAANSQGLVGKIGLGTHAVGDPYIFLNLNPFRYNKLALNRWLVQVKDVTLNQWVRREDGSHLAVVVESFPDIRWNINASMFRAMYPPKRFKSEYGKEFRKDPSSVPTSAGWALSGNVQFYYDETTLDLSYDFLERIRDSAPFLSTLGKMADFLEKVMGKVPLGLGSVVMPNFAVYVASEPYEQDSLGLVGYQWKLGFFAAPLVAVQIEWNLLDFILASFPATLPAVAVLNVLRYGVGIKGTLSVQADIGIYLTANDQIELQLEWSRETPGEHVQSGQIDHRVEFQIEGRCVGEFSAFVVSAGGGVQIGGRVVLGMTGQAERGEDSPTAFAGQFRWEGITLYFARFFEFGLSVGSFTRTSTRTSRPEYQVSTLQLGKAHYWPKAPKPHRVGNPLAAAARLAKKAGAQIATASTRLRPRRSSSSGSSSPTATPPPPPPPPSSPGSSAGSSSGQVTTRGLSTPSAPVDAAQGSSSYESVDIDDSTSHESGDVDDSTAYESGDVGGSTTQETQVHEFDVFKGTGLQGQDVHTSDEELTRLAGLDDPDVTPEQREQERALKERKRGVMRKLRAALMKKKKRAQTSAANTGAGQGGGPTSTGSPPRS